MSLQNELQDNEYYETETGTPTLTIELADHQFMLPWSTFVSGIFKGNEIHLTLGDHTIHIRGNGLAELWRELQMQDVRLLAQTHGISLAIQVADETQGNR